ncbi:MAG: histidine kinase [Nitrospira sp.]|nr:histidine kinase [Nitrospira sp.]MCP9462522.1 histidine kinase [Nitrospira sp.]MCP9475360.1 histidine kinase [Nitrospira sp.]
MTITTNPNTERDAADSRKTLLVGVNDLFFYAKIREALLPHGYRLEKALSQDDIEEKMSSLHPAAVLLDMNDLAIDAVRALKTLKEDRRFTTIPVLAYASHEDVETWNRARSLGVDRIVTRNEMSARARDLVEEILSGVQ